MISKKKAQGLGGFIKVFIVIIFFLALFPLVNGIFFDISTNIYSFDVALSVMTYIPVILLIWFMVKYIFNLGDEPL